MRTRTPPRPKGHVIPDFTPVPRKKVRHDGWTPARQRGFIEALARTGSVEHAAKAVNMTTVGAYQLRLAPGAESFREAWTAALDFGVQMLEDVAMQRALYGVAVPVFGKEGQIGEKRWYNDRLLMFLLRHRLSDRYGDQRHDRLTPKREAELRAAWKAEQSSNGSRALEELMAKLRQIKQRQEEHKRLGLTQEEDEDAFDDWEEEEDQPSPDAGQPQEQDEPHQGKRIRSL